MISHSSLLEATMTITATGCLNEPSSSQITTLPGMPRMSDAMALPGVFEPSSTTCRRSPLDAMSPTGQAALKRHSVAARSAIPRSIVSASAQRSGRAGRDAAGLQAIAPSLSFPPAFRRSIEDPEPDAKSGPNGLLPGSCRLTVAVSDGGASSTSSPTSSGSCTGSSTSACRLGSGCGLPGPARLR